MTRFKLFLISACLAINLTSGTPWASQEAIPQMTDLTQSEIAQNFREAIWEYDFSGPSANLLPNFEISRHDTIFEVNATSDNLFTSSYIDNKLQDEIFSALNEWYGEGMDPEFVVVFKGWESTIWVLRIPLPWRVSFSECWN